MIINSFYLIPKFFRQCKQKVIYPSQTPLLLMSLKRLSGICSLSNNHVLLLSPSLLHPQCHQADLPKCRLQKSLSLLTHRWLVTAYRLNCRILHNLTKIHLSSFFLFHIYWEQYWIQLLNSKQFCVPVLLSAQFLFPEIEALDFPICRKPWNENPWHDQLIWEILLDSSVKTSLTHYVFSCLLLHFVTKLAHPDLFTMFCLTVDHEHLEVGVHIIFSVSLCCHICLEHSKCLIIFGCMNLISTIML